MLCKEIFILLCLILNLRGNLITGRLIIAEVASRFQSEDDFRGQVQKFGFTLLKGVENGMLLERNDYFFLDIFKPAKNFKVKRNQKLNLKPCIYKRR